jgi:hypothetical protein
MPLIKPEIQEVLRQSGLAKEKTSSETPLNQVLDAAGLDINTIAEELFHLAKNSGNESLRLRALETALKARGALKESAPAAPSFTLVINSSSPSNPNLQPGVPADVNQILIPRQLLKVISEVSVPDKVD